MLNLQKYILKLKNTGIREGIWYLYNWKVI